jgi:hypothetical protein
MSFSFSPSIQGIGLPFELKGSCKPCLPSTRFFGSEEVMGWYDLLRKGLLSSSWSLEFDGLESQWIFIFMVKFCYLVKKNWRKTWNENQLVKCVFHLELYKQLQSPITFIQHKVTFQGVLSIIGKRMLEVLWNDPGNAYSTQEHGESNGGNPPFC